MNHVSNSGRGITAIELDDITHFKLDATSFPSIDIMYRYGRCSGMVNLGFVHSFISLSITPASMRGLSNQRRINSKRCSLPAILPRNMARSVLLRHGILSFVNIKWRTLSSFSSTALWLSPPIGRLLTMLGRVGV